MGYGERRHPLQAIKTRKTGEIEPLFPAAGLFEVMRSP